MRQTENELKLVKKFIELPYLLDVLERDKKKITDSNLKMCKLYITQLDQIQNLVSAEIFEIRQKLRRSGIKIIEQRKLEDRLITDYLCRGYKLQITLLWSKVKFDIEVILAQYLNIDIYNT